MSYQHIFGRFARHLPCSEIGRACREAEEQAKRDGRFAIEVPGGWLFGHLSTQYGLVFGNERDNGRV